MTTLKNTSIYQFFDAKEIGRSFAEVAFDVIETEMQNVVSHWYHSDQDADIYIWLDEVGNVIKQQVNFVGQVVEWNIVEGIKTGVTLEDENNSEPNLAKAFVRFDIRPISEVVRQAKELLEFAHSVDQVLRQTLLDNFTSGVSMATMGSDELLQKFGAHLKKKEHESILQKVITKLSSWFKEE